MNTELLKITLNWLEAGAPERRFNMSKMVEFDDLDNVPNNWCGTACCIAGYVWQLDKKPHDIEGGLYSFWDTIEKQAAKMLELDFPVAHRLFYPASTETKEAYPGSWGEITPEQAAQAVRNVITRGEPYWEEILDFTEEEY